MMSQPDTVKLLMVFPLFSLSVVLTRKTTEKLETTGSLV